VPGLKPRLAFVAIADITRRTDCSGIPGVGSGDIPPRAVVGSHAYCFAVDDAFLQSRRESCAHGDCQVLAQRGKATLPTAHRHNPREEASSDPRQKLVADSD